MKLLFEVAPVSNMFQKKMGELSRGKTNVISIAVDILIAGLDE